ncbi:hypothetical protein FEF65_02490 [Mariprofundus erugo]|uniref:NlpE C-terminal OB domain-containing protein n=1 Tax=Mariprofundus erugo TaxID=2528639 RepID=A0A5R9GUA6_9PROT|nr:hypothetical protein [Mariprofundus erugo]TLS68595.1 hypothetical protein FEF65_02490 [Mariprofundus erugo]
MKKFWVLLMLFSFMQLTACANPSKEIEAFYTWGEGVNSVYVCSEAKEYWVDAPEPVLKQLEAEYLHRTKSPYEHIFIIFLGGVKNEKLDGFALNYDGLMRVNKVIQFGGNIPAACQKNM